MIARSLLTQTPKLRNYRTFICTYAELRKTRVFADVLFSDFPLAPAPAAAAAPKKTSRGAMSEGRKRRAVVIRSAG